MTPGSDEKPTRRLLKGYRDERPLLVELTSRDILVRPKGTRKGGKQEVSISASALYDRLILSGRK